MYMYVRLIIVESQINAGCGELRAHMEHPQMLVCDKSIEAGGILQPCIETESGMMC